MRCVAYATEERKLSQKSDDLRVQRTRKLLQQALFELTIEHGFSGVTVLDIAKRAMVNRSTFYRHYLDKYDLLDQYMDDLEAEISAAAKLHMDEVPAGLLLLIRHVQMNAAFYRVMLGAKGDQAFTHRFQQLSQNRYRYVFAKIGITDETEIGFKLSYISNAVVGVILWWLENNQPITPEQLALRLGGLNRVTSAWLGG